ncbi:site-specific DNA-methyltransferase [Lactobacillus amylovorus]|uniref:site-specific DNA-methyltransferase n=1 Tax=Lactobacillus amylovorus TaxID=1604 RepID=UPI00232AF906|nr:site-specific DNA-methyltransferase [Lactobacillus amylovorus]MDB6256337.1 site-specific DNA-methyltransferase [Lactobacillus amylovorus]
MAVESKAMDHIRKVLEQFGDKYFTKSGALKRNTVIEDLDNYDEDLMTAILKDDLLHKTYTSKIADVEIFEINKFVDMLHYKEYWEDSFTKYDNKIGLTAGDKYLDYSSDVVLDFPYKDCVLKAGMTKEDVEHSGDADEPFLNEILAKPEIDELFESKIFINATRYDKNGKTKASSISDDDNLIVKGNNLIALYSLEERYGGKVKLIYLDPPYNTKGKFGYNDSFNHSSWLTFMKNRLEISKRLLSKDGSIWITLDNTELNYLKVLADSILGRENFITTIAWRSSDNSNNDAKQFSNDFNEILVYSLAGSSWLPNKVKRSLSQSKHYSNPNNDPRGPWFDGNPLGSPNYRENLIYDIKAPNGNVIHPPKNGWRWSKETLKEKMKTGEIYFNKDFTNIKRKTYLYEQSPLPPSNLWFDLEITGHNRQAKNEQKVLFKEKDKDKLFSTPKPEKLLEQIIHIGSDENDLVLDFFMGSATTQAVAMKMHRRFIGIEQMDYINTISVPRLQKVIAGEQGGISKAVKWQGGGSFVYTELMEKDQSYIRDLQNAENMDELMNVYSLMKQNGDIDFRVDLNKFEASLKAGELPSLADRKKELVKIIDKNQLYYNYSDIDDESIRNLVSDTDYEFNKSFYSSNHAIGEE